MFTKSVVTCIVSGALVSVILPGGSLIRCAQAQKVPVRKATQSFQSAKGSGTVTAPIQQEHKKTPSTKEHPAKITSSVPLPSTVGQQGKKRKLSVKHLGAFTVRAYTKYRRSPGKTASGTRPTAGRTVAVDPRVIPLGSKIHIEGVGERIAEDTGGKIKGKRLDLFLPSVEKCREFGKRTLDVHVLTE